MTYTPTRPATSVFLTVRGLRQHALHWPGQGRPLVLLHGWMDVAASFQFLVDALNTEQPVWALDWRGYGQSAWSGQDAYWFYDYLGDLDAWLDHIAPGTAVDLVGHSMGANAATLYAGVRPARVQTLVNLEGFGLPDMPATQAPDRLARWLDALREPTQLAPYPDQAAVAARLQRNNPRLTPDRAAWLAGQWSAEREDGRRVLCADPAHKRPHAQLYRSSEVLACWARIQAPTLFVEGEDDSLAAYWGAHFPRAELDARLAHIPRLERTRLMGTGHMLHHDDPEGLANVLQAFWEGVKPR
ncbi:alpha/beta fold hydrolase [Inhella gelatinilytica]|uniref:Alpha/beta hydrolase n=1 Tax=Inhella gelatinilytica TaxID=2795030 RepID=A0A931NEM8_9BURK|nr:alpha/beta hydrolase [Inhella gelatinilytica]MBH9552681.1 alpha/beta hydrolase [Inhella gelatinilytica]